MSNFWKQLLESRPSCAGLTVYFCPTYQPGLECVIQIDGTVSPKCAPSLRFESAMELADAVLKGELDKFTKFRIPRSMKATQFVSSMDFYLDSSRRNCISQLMTVVKPTQKKEEDQKTTPGTNRSEIDQRSPAPSEIWASETNLDDQGGYSGVNEPAETMDTVPSQSGSNVLCVGGYTEIILDDGQETDDYQPRIVLATKPCPGLDRDAYLDVIELRKWETSRRQFSPVFIQGDRLWSKSCVGEILRMKTVCSPCQRAALAIRRTRQKYKRHPVSEERRIKYSRNRWLTTEERLLKAEMLLEKQKEQIQSMKARLTRVRSLELELKKYRPIYWENRPAIQSLVRYLDEESRLIKDPVCQWENGETVCSVRAESSSDLRVHVRETHIRPNPSDSVVGAVYECKWKGCLRPQYKFTTFKSFDRHVSKHCGNPKRKAHAARLRNQLLGVTRLSYRFSDQQSAQLHENGTQDDADSTWETDGRGEEDEEEDEESQVAVEAITGI